MKVNHILGKLPRRKDAATVLFPFGTLRYAAESSQQNAFSFGTEPFVFRQLSEARRSSRQRRCFTAYLLEPMSGLLAEEVIMRRATFEASALKHFTARQISRLHAIARQGFPTLSAARFFANLEVDPLSLPTLNEYDAYAVTQAAIWRVLEDADPTKIVMSQFMQCDDPTAPHEKNPKLSQALHALYLKIVAESDKEEARGDGLHRTLSITSFGRYGKKYISQQRVHLGPFAVIGGNSLAVSISLHRNATGTYLVNKDNVRISRILPEQHFFISMRRRNTKKSLVIIARQASSPKVTPYIAVRPDADNEGKQLPSCVGIFGVKPRQNVARRVIYLRRRRGLRVR